jgi:hypothetical protein
MFAKKAPLDSVRDATADLFADLAARNASLARLLRTDVGLEARTIANLLVEGEKYQRKLAMFEARLADR